MLLLDASGRVVWLTHAARSRFAPGDGSGRAAADRALAELSARVRSLARARGSAGVRCTIAGEAVTLSRVEAASDRAAYLATWAAEGGVGRGSP